MTATATAGPTVREILAAGQCSAACLLSALKPERCGCRCLGQYHGAALAALGLTSQPPRGEGERASARTIAAGPPAQPRPGSPLR